MADFITDTILAARDEGRLFIRSTLKNAASYHAWPDQAGRLSWSKPQTEHTSGDWRSPQTTIIVPHQGGLHAARPHALSYWIGPEIYLMESALNATLVYKDDVIATSKARLLGQIPTPDCIWFDFACACLETLVPFREFYNYDTELGSSLKRGPIHPSLTKVFEQAEHYYDFQTTLDTVKRRFDAGEKILSDSEKQTIENHGIQAIAHKISHGREAAYDLHNEAILNTLKAFGQTSLFFKQGVTAYQAAQQILKSAANAFEAAGREQQTLMLGKHYTIAHGLGPLFASFPFIPHESLNAVEFGRLARRGFMLEMNNRLLSILNLKNLFENSLQSDTTVGDIITAITPALRDLEATVKPTGMTRS